MANVLGRIAGYEVHVVARDASASPACAHALSQADALRCVRPLFVLDGDEYIGVACETVDLTLPQFILFCRTWSGHESARLVVLSQLWTAIDALRKRGVVLGNVSVRALCVRRWPCVRC